MKQKFIGEKKVMKKSIITVRDFNSLLSILDITGSVEDLNNIIYQALQSIY